MAEPNDQLRQARIRTESPATVGEGLSRQELADRVNAWVYEHRARVGAVDAHYIGKLERGAIRWPHADYRDALRVVLSAAADHELGFRPPRRSPGNREHIEPPGPRPGPPLGPPGATHEPRDAAFTPIPLQSRSQVFLPTTRGNERAVTWLEGSAATPGGGPREREIMTGADETFEFIVHAERAAARPEVLDLLHRQVRTLAATFPSTPTRPVDALLHTQRAIFRMLDGPTEPAQARDLYFLGAVTCGLLASAGIDASQPSTAHIYARAAYLCADRAGHPGLRTWVRVYQARCAYWFGAPHEALHYLGIAEADATAVTGTMPAHLAVQQARAFAAIGDVPSARAAIARASAARDRARTDDLDEIGGELTLLVPVQLYVAADTLSWLPDYAAAERAAAEALSAFEAPGSGYTGFGSKAAARADLALARTRLGELDGAAEALRPVLDLPAGRRTHGIRKQVHRVHAALCESRHAAAPAARDAAAEIEAFCQTTRAERIPD